MQLFSNSPKSAEKNPYKINLTALTVTVNNVAKENLFFITHLSQSRNCYAMLRILHKGYMHINK